MRLKIVTTAFLILGLCLLVGWPIIVGRPVAKDAPLKSRQLYAAKFGLYFIGVVGCFAVTSVLAMMVVRRQKDQFRKEAHGNLQMLIDQSLEDHRDNKS